MVEQVALFQYILFQFTAFCMSLNSQTCKSARLNKYFAVFQACEKG